MNKHASAAREWAGRPSLTTLGSFIHSLWHGPNFIPVDRRTLMCRVANELLGELGDPRTLSNDATNVDEQLHADIFVRSQEPKDVRESLLLDALYAALTLVNSSNDLASEPHLGVRVYHPLMVLEGLLLKQTANALHPRKAVTHAVLGKFRVEYMEARKDNERGWQVAAAKHFTLSTRQVSRIWNET